MAVVVVVIGRKSSTPPTRVDKNTEGSMLLSPTPRSAYPIVFILLHFNKMCLERTYLIVYIFLQVGGIYLVATNYNI